MGCGDIVIKIGKELVVIGVEKGLQAMGVPPVGAKMASGFLNFFLD